MYAFAKVRVIAQISTQAIFAHKLSIPLFQSIALSPSPCHDIYVICVDCDNAFPLRIEFEHVEALEDEPDIPKTLHILSRIDYPVLYAAASQLEIKDLPEELPDDLNAQRDEKLLIALHNAIFNVRYILEHLITHSTFYAHSSF